jgi:hypothetical protein
MKAGDYGLVLFAVGSAILLVFSPLYSPDLALVPPQPVNSPRFTLLYYVPRVVLSGVLLAASIVIIFTENFSKRDRYWAYGLVGAVLGSWGFWLRD